MIPPLIFQMGKSWGKDFQWHYNNQLDWKLLSNFRLKLSLSSVGWKLWLLSGLQMEQYWTQLGWVKPQNLSKPWTLTTGRMSSTPFQSQLGGRRACRARSNHWETIWPLATITISTSSHILSPWLLFSFSSSSLIDCRIARMVRYVGYEPALEKFREVRS